VCRQEDNHGKLEDLELSHGNLQIALDGLDVRVQPDHPRQHPDRRRHPPHLHPDGAVLLDARHVEELRPGDEGAGLLEVVRSVHRRHPKGEARQQLVGEDVAKVVLRDAPELAHGLGPARRDGQRGAERNHHVDEEDGVEHEVGDGELHLGADCRHTECETVGERPHFVG